MTEHIIFVPLLWAALILRLPLLGFVYALPRSYRGDEERVERVLRHERLGHRAQIDRYGPWFFYTRWLFSRKWRLSFEAEAYAHSVLWWWDQGRYQYTPGVSVLRHYGAKLARWYYCLGVDEDDGALEILQHISRLRLGV
jgi:hypothetical protein